MRVARRFANSWRAAREGFLDACEYNHNFSKRFAAPAANQQQKFSFWLR
jgi:hypothetical protein